MRRHATEYSYASKKQRRLGSTLERALQALSIVQTCVVA